MDTTLILIIVAVVLVVAGAVVVAVRRRPRSVSEELAEARRSTAPTAAPPKLEERLSKSRSTLGGALRSVLNRGQLDTEAWERMEEALISVDAGVDAATRIVGRVRDAQPADPAAARDLLHREVLGVLEGRDRELQLVGDPAVVMVVGVNGTGKTTSIAKLAAHLRDEGREPILGAADTFRAAAVAQLQHWGETIGVDVVGGQEGADPASVAYDAYAAGKARGMDVVIVDTAGRLHSKKNLMGELGKIHRVLTREAGEVGEVLLVLDATGGQNGIAQAREFLSAVGVTGIVLTKLDGSARGGIVVAIEEELGIPVKLIGIGEGVEDLVPFEPAEFVDALLADAR